MKKLTLSFLMSLSTFFAYAQMADPTPSVSEAGSSTATLTVLVTDLDSDNGKLLTALYASEGKWLSTAYMGKISDIVDGAATVTFSGVPYGSYAISTFHDENDNGVLDTGLFKIPTEPYASSRGAKGRFGPPKWKDAIFEVSESEITESIKY